VTSPWIVTFSLFVDRRSVDRLLAAVHMAVARGAKQITIAMTCKGGSGGHAMRASREIAELPSDVELTTHNVGGALSSAALLFLAGRRRLVSPGAGWMLHPRVLYGRMANVTAEQLLAWRDSGDRDQVETEAYLSERTGRPRVEVRGWCDGLLRPPALAVQEGIAHAIAPLQIPAGATLFPIVEPTAGNLWAGG